MKMNRKKLLLLSFLLIICLIGCGKNEKEAEVIAQGELSLLGENKEYEGADHEATEDETESLEEIPEEQVISFECLDEIREATPESGLVQIDDMLFQYGCKVSEAIETIENSQSTFEYYHEYIENELITPGSFTDSIILLKNNQWYFKFRAKNISDETISLKECPVVEISAEKASKGNVFYAGFKDENNNCVMYDYIKNIMSDCKMVWEGTEYDDEGLRMISVRYKISSDVSPEGFFYVDFIFDSASGELNQLKLLVYT